MTLENLFIEQLMSNKQLLKRGRLIAWRQAERRLPLGGRKFAGADKKKLWRKSESWEAVPPASGERLPKVAAGENRKCRAPQVFGEAPVTPSIVSQDK